ncbi:hypothetical protein Tco_0513824, partial [Tanacetum coccineum]
SAAATEIPTPAEGGQKDVEDAYLELADPGEGMAMVRQSEEEVVTEQPKKAKKKRLQKRGDVLPAKKLRTDHPSLASGTRESESFVDLSAQESLQIRTTVGSSSILSTPIDTAAATTTSTRAKLAADVNPDLASSSHSRRSVGMSIGGTLPMIRCWAMAFPAVPWWTALLPPAFLMRQLPLAVKRSKPCTSSMDLGNFSYKRLISSGWVIPCMNPEIFMHSGALSLLPIDFCLYLSIKVLRGFSIYFALSMDLWEFVEPGL